MSLAVTKKGQLRERQLNKPTYSFLFAALKKYKLLG